MDSILIDEARTPLIISGPAEESTDLYYRIDRIIPRLKRAATIVEGKLSEIEAQKVGDYIVDEKSKAVALTEQGIAELRAPPERRQPLRSPAHHGPPPHPAGLRAHTLYRRDVDYVVKDGEVIIVDEFTGRLMPGRRWSDGLHQAVEAKEGVRIERENQTLATITFQNYFRMYAKLAGMTGTAETEAEEFAKIYKLDVTVIPTNRALIRCQRARRRLQDRAREVRRGGGGHHRSPREGPARAGRHGVHREVRAAVQAAQEARASATRSSTPSTTSARRRSWPRPVARAR